MRKARIFLPLALAALMTLSIPAGALAKAPNGIEIVVPEAYEQSGTLPVYRAQVRNQRQANFFDKVELGWFNQSGQKDYENWSKRARFDHFVFHDGAWLDIDADTVSYRENSGDMQIEYDDPGIPPEIVAKPAFSNEVYSLGSTAYHGDVYELPHEMELEKTQLNGVSLDGAKAEMEELLKQTGVEGFECVYALDMSVNRIRELGEWKNRRIEDGLWFADIVWDYGIATAEDEGFFLMYSKKLNGAVVGGTRSFDASALVTASGIRYFSLCDPYVAGEIYETPEKLLDATEILPFFHKSVARKDHSAEVISIDKMELIYTPARAASKKEGMVFEPVWRFSYTIRDEGSHETQPYGWGMYSALDGQLLGDLYQCD